MPLLRQRLSLDSCPDAETLISANDGSLCADVSAAIYAHIAECPACALLQERLLTFNRAAPLEHEAEWRRAEKRLDHWIEDFLGAGTGVLQRGRKRTPRLSVWWDRISGPFHFLASRWMIGAAAASLILVGSGYLLTRFETRPSVQMSARTTASQEGPGDVPSEQNRVDKSVSGDQTSNRAGDTAIQPMGPLPAPVNPPGDEAHSAPRGEVFTALPQTLATPEAPTLAQAQPPNLAEVPPAPASVSQSVQAKGPVQTVSPLPHNRGAIAAVPSGGGITGNAVGPPSRGGTTSWGAIASLPVRTTRSDLPTSHANGRREPASVTALPSVQLVAGTRLWISVKSLAPLPTRDFEFRGTLLLAVEHAGTVPAEL